MTSATPKPSHDGTLIKALVRAHRWRRHIESGRARSITDLSEQEGVTVLYYSCIGSIGLIANIARLEAADAQ